MRKSHARNVATDLSTGFRDEVELKGLLLSLAKSVSRL